MKISPDSSMKEQIIVEAANSDKAHGMIINNPGIRADIGWHDDELDSLPTTPETEWGHYTSRSATIEWFGDTIEQYKGNGSITAGSYLKLAFNSKTKKMEVSPSENNNPTNWIAMEGIGANTLGIIRVLCRH